MTQVCTLGRWTRKDIFLSHNHACMRRETKGTYAVSLSQCSASTYIWSYSLHSGTPALSWASTPNGAAGVCFLWPLVVSNMSSH